jgi:hypothetical protein
MMAIQTTLIQLTPGTHWGKNAGKGKKMTNNKLTDERGSSERIDAIIRSAERYLSRRGELDFSADGVEETIAAMRELRQRRAADRNYFMYGIAEPDGCAYLDEVCVSRDIGVLQSIADELNINEGTDGYRVVALYTALPLTDDERRELQEYRKAESEHIYQVQYANGWQDVELSAFEDHVAHGSPVRIVYTAPPQAPAVEVRPIAFFDGDISPDDAEKLTAAIRELNNAPSEPAILAAVEAVPVVPDEISTAEIPYSIGQFRTHRECYRDGWNACRAAGIGVKGE